MARPSSKVFFVAFQWSRYWCHQILRPFHLCEASAGLSLFSQRVPTKLATSTHLYTAQWLARSFVLRLPLRDTDIPMIFHFRSIPSSSSSSVAILAQVTVGIFLHRGLSQGGHRIRIKCCERQQAVLVLRISGTELEKAGDRAHDGREGAKTFTT